MAGYIGY